MKWFEKDLTDYRIVEKVLKNPCGEIIKSEYYIEHAKYTFGIKRYKPVMLISYGITKTSKDIFYSESKEFLIKEYKKLVASEIKIVHYENICE